MQQKKQLGMKTGLDANRHEAARIQRRKISFLNLRLCAFICGLLIE